MVRVTIDGRKVEVAEGATILEAARAAGIEIPTMCYRPGWEASTSCMVCLVRVKGQHSLQPACAAPVRDGMEIESETPEVHGARRTAVELLLSDHVGDCRAPCQSTCPAGMDIPLMIRHLTRHEWREAVATVKRDIALPGVLGRICPAPCEKACRRAACDQALSICLLKRAAADADLAMPVPFRPACRPDTGRRVAVIGGGPAGLAAAYHLLEEGIRPVVIDDRAQPGGRLRERIDPARLPGSVLDAEAAVIAGLGAEFRMNTRVGRDIAFADLVAGHDAVVLAVGEWAAPEGFPAGLDVTGHGLAVNPRTGATNLPRVFACGDAVRKTEMAVIAVAAGKTVARAVAEFLRTGSAHGADRAFSVHIGRVRPEERAVFLQEGAPRARVEPAGGLATGFAEDEVKAEAQRCLHCDCRRTADCRLRELAVRYGAKASRYKSERRAFEHDLGHPDIVYEPGKCILCGLCVQAAERAGDEPGLTLEGRSYDVRVRVPLAGDIAGALAKSGKACVAVCPTGALALKA